MIYAHSPEAKGRIERLFNTLQDRLIPEMRIAGVKNMKQANEYLQKKFIPHQYHPRFTVQAENPRSAFIPVHPNLDLGEIFCIKEYRVVARDHTISLDGEVYGIITKLKHSIYKQRIEIRRYKKGKIKAFYGGEELKIGKVTKYKYQVA